MLALESSRSESDSGTLRRETSTSGCFTPSSNTAKSPSERSGTFLFRRSLTVTFSETTSIPDL